MCNNAPCNWDGGDCGCNAKCSEGSVRTRQIGDGHCDAVCFNEHCDWDGGDCECGSTCSDKMVSYN